jgi:uncharacterized membrane protein YcaP (DUF421 family)
MTDLTAMLVRLFGADPPHFTALQMSLRAAVIFVLAILLIRLGAKRFMGRNSTFDVVLGVILGSVLSRAINGSAPFGASMVAGTVLVGLHYLFASLAFRSQRFETLVKGHVRQLVADGAIQWDTMRHVHISRTDLDAAIRADLHHADLGRVQAAYLERSGSISVIPTPTAPHILEIAIPPGTTTLRLVIGAAEED